MHASTSLSLNVNLAQAQHDSWHVLDLVDLVLCMCVCVREREKQQNRDRDEETKTERQRRREIYIQRGSLSHTLNPHTLPRETETERERYTTGESVWVGEKEKKR